MLKIKLSRTGTKNRPSYRVVVTPDRSKITGAPVEYLGYYSPLEKKLKIDKEKVADWIKKGAQPTPRILRLLRKV